MSTFTKFSPHSLSSLTWWHSLLMDGWHPLTLTVQPHQAHLHNGCVSPPANSIHKYWLSFRNWKEPLLHRFSYFTLKTLPPKYVCLYLTRVSATMVVHSLLTTPLLQTDISADSTLVFCPYLPTLLNIDYLSMQTSSPISPAISLKLTTLFTHTGC